MGAWFGVQARRGTTAVALRCQRLSVQERVQLGTTARRDRHLQLKSHVSAGSAGCVAIRRDLQGLCLLRP